MIHENLKKIIKVIMFIKDINMKDITNNVNADFSYACLKNYLTYHSGMKIENLEKLFKAIDFPFIEALKLSEEKLTRIELIKRILNEVEQ